MKLEFGKYNNQSLGGVLFHLLLSVGLLLILCVLYFYVYLPATTNHDESITVPDVEGKTLEELETELGKRTLSYVINDSSYSSKYPPNTVLRQFPHAGAKVKEGRTISISINRSSAPLVPVPDLVDGSVVNASSVLQSSELVLGKIEYVPGPFNIVKEMRYRGGKLNAGDRVPKGARIDLVVMTDNNSFPIPSLLGMSLEDARFVIIGDNLGMGQIHILGDTTGVGAVVLKQKPAPEENIMVGDNVELWVGKPGTPIDEEEDLE